MTWTGRRRIIAALRGEAVDRPPVWMMRQAGRYLPEYRALRKEHSFLEMVGTPALAAEVTLQPIRRFGFDAAILFCDILTIPEALGLEVKFPKGGPKLSPTVQTAAEVAALPRPDVVAELGYVADAIREIRRLLDDDVALLGFSGAPWTLATYMVEGGGSKSFPTIRAMMHREPETLEALLERLADVVIDYLQMQIDAGVDAVQLFDTWAGELRAEDYERLLLPTTRRIVQTLRDRGATVVLFARHPGHLLESTLKAGPNAIGVDWRVDLAHAAELAAAAGVSLQGNLDPAELFASPAHIKARIEEMHRAIGGRTGWVVNLGHGIWPAAPISGVQALVDAVHGLGEQA